MVYQEKQAENLVDLRYITFVGTLGARTWTISSPQFHSGEACIIHICCITDMGVVYNGWFFQSTPRTFGIF